MFLLYLSFHGILCHPDPESGADICPNFSLDNAAEQHTKSAQLGGIQQVYRRVSNRIDRPRKWTAIQTSHRRLG